MKNKNISFMTQAAMIAAIYVVLTYVFAPFSFGEVQVRISEALTILPVFTPAAIPGLFIGCLIGNILGGAILPDIIFGSIATLIGAFFTWKLREKSPYLAPVPNRGQRNSSFNLPYIAEAIGNTLGIGKDEAAKLTMENGKRFFCIS